VRDGSLILLSLTSLASLALVACGSGPSTTNERSSPTPSEAEVARSKSEPEPRAEPSPEPAPSPDQAERVADLERLCQALDHDYVDGTLSDYYAKVEPTTAWGREQLRVGEESITPGRLLQKAATEIAANLDTAELAGCRKLFDVIDELE